MSHQISPTHPAVVLRSHYKQVRSLLAVAMIAVVGLTAALVIIASDDNSRTSVSDAPKSAVVPSSPRMTPQQAGLTAEATPATGAQADGLRYDGGPEEGSTDVVPSTPRVTAQQAFPGLAAEATQAQGAQADGLRYDGGPEEGTRGPAQSISTSAPADGLRYDGGPEEGTRGPVTFSGTR